jgi:hypothetical protein
MSAGAVMGSVFALLVCASACGNEYRCPDPIGKIVRDDCQSYKVKYDSLKVELGFSIGGLSFGVKAGKNKLRDPSELIQVLMLETMALCKDYNACRVPSADYRRRREAADRKFTAVVAINQQLKGETDKETKKKLLAKLIEVITERPRTVATKPRGRSRRGRYFRRIVYHPGMFRKPTLPWFGSKFMPARPQLPDGLPVLAKWWIGHGSGIGKSSHIAFTFFGKTEADDRVYIRFSDTAETFNAPVKPRRGKPIGKARAHVRGKHVGKRGTMTLQYKQGATGKKHLVGTFRLDPQVWLKRGYLAYQADPVRRDPVEYERPWIIFYSKVKRNPRTTMRCSYNGKKIDSVLVGLNRYNPYRASKLTIHAVPLPVRIGVKGGSERTTWKKTVSGQRPIQDLLPNEAAGKWVCVSKINARKARVFRFALRSDGSVKTHRKPDDGAWPWWPLDTKRVQNSIETAAEQEDSR